MPRVEAPSSRLRTFRQRDGLFTVQYPANWRVHEAARGYGVVFAPEGGVAASRGGSEVVHGVVINHYEPFEGRWGGTLEEATEDLLGQIRRTAPHLRPVGRPERQRTADGQRVLSTALAGRNPGTGVQESVTVVTRQLPDDHVLYALVVGPREDSAPLSRAFGVMLDTLRVDGRVAHR
jgi:hypothetical protein